MVVSAIAAQDPRNRPADKREAAEAALAQFNHPKSDFMTYLNIWQAYQVCPFRQPLSPWHCYLQHNETVYLTHVHSF